LPVVDFLNYKIVEGNKFEFNKGILVVSGSLITGGLLWTSLRFDKFRTDGNRKIRISDY